MFPVAVSLFKSHGVSVLVLKPGGKNVVENISVWKKKKPPLFSIFQVTELCSAICRAWLNDVGDWRLCQGDVVPQSKKTGAALTFRAQSKPFLLWFPFEQSACLFLFPWKGLSWGAYCMQGIEELFWSEFVMLWERVCSLVAQTPPV